MKSLPLLLLALGATHAPTIVPAARAHDVEARALVKRVIDSAPDVPFTAENTLTTPGDLERQFTSSVKPLGGETDGHYLEVTAPFNVKDVRYLFYERSEGQDEQFMYLPSMKRIVRLTETSRREPFLGSTFYVTDMVAPALDDFTYDFVGEETVGGRKCRLVRALPKNPEKELYGKSVFAIDPEDLVVMRTELFDKDGKPFKLHVIDRIEKIDGYWTPLRQTMKNVQDQTQSRLETSQVRYDVPLGDEIFRLAHLGR
jgi:outer membrane lipoprotein-sorting protein